MVKKRFSETEIQKILREYVDGVPISRIIEENGISQATFYNWKAKYSSFSSNDLEKLNKLREENDRLKRMYADLSLENLSLKAQLEKRN
jgi:putative transposase